MSSLTHRNDTRLGLLHLVAAAAARREADRSRSPKFVTVHQWVGATLQLPQPTDRRIYLTTEVDRADFYTG
jgi:hypothetical protein